MLHRYALHWRQWFAVHVQVLCCRFNAHGRRGAVQSIFGTRYARLSIVGVQFAAQVVLEGTVPSQLIQDGSSGSEKDLIDLEQDT